MNAGLLSGISTLRVDAETFDNTGTVKGRDLSFDGFFLKNSGTIRAENDARFYLKSKLENDGAIIGLNSIVVTPDVGESLLSQNL